MNWAVGILFLLLTVSVYINVDLIKSGAAFSKAFSAKGTVILTPNLTEALLSDLKSGDKARLEAWWLFFNQYTNAQYYVSNKGLNDTLKLYNSKEKPGRSNYFNRMVFELHAEQATRPLSKATVMGFLGEPNAISQASGAEILSFTYSCEGIEYLTLVTVTNRMVQQIQICVKPPKESAPFAEGTVTNLEK